MCQRVFRAGCAVRAGHVAVTWVVSWTLFLHDTDLRRCEEKGELARPAGFALLVLLSVLLYFAASLMDPGFVRADCELTATSDGHAELEDMMPGASTSCQLRRCGYCLLLQPMRAKHCRVCKHCVRRYDHHCPWIGNCVGERNHRWFLLYLVAQLLALLWAVQTSWSGIIFAPTVVVDTKCISLGGSGLHWSLLRCGDSPAWLPSVPGLHQHHHLGVHVPPPYFILEKL